MALAEALFTQLLGTVGLQRSVWPYREEDIEQVSFAELNFWELSR